MKLRNKKTGEIRELPDGFFCGDNLKKICEEWEDYEDELYYIISAEHKGGYICALKEDYKELCETAKELGIGFETEKEARKAVEKLKAWKRLKDNGFKIKDWKFTPDIKQIQGNYVKIEAEIPQILINKKDLDLLFGGEE